MQVSYLLLRWRLYPCRHLILFIVCRCEPGVIRLIAPEIVQKVDRKQRRELSSLLNLLNLVSGKFDCQSIRHCLHVLDSVDTHYGKHVGRLCEKIGQGLQISTRWKSSGTSLTMDWSVAPLRPAILSSTSDTLMSAGVCEFACRILGSLSACSRCCLVTSCPPPSAAQGTIAMP